MPPIEETFVPGHVPSVRMRDRTIDVNSMELEVIDAPPRLPRSWTGGTLLAASLSLVVGTAAFFLLDETPFRTSASSSMPPSLRAAPSPLPLPASPEAESTSELAQPVEPIRAEPIQPSVQEAKPLHVSKVAPEAGKLVRKRSPMKRTRAVTSTSSRTVTKRTTRR